MITVPFSEEHPFHAQVMYVERIPFPLPGLADVDAPAGYATMGWGFRKWPRREDRVEFSAENVEAFGMPAPTIHYELTERELAEQERALANLERAGFALGKFPSGGGPRVMPKARCTTWARSGWARRTTGRRCATPTRASGASRTCSSAATE